MSFILKLKGMRWENVTPQLLRILKNYLADRARQTFGQWLWVNPRRLVSFVDLQVYRQRVLFFENSLTNVTLELPREKFSMVLFDMCIQRVTSTEGRRAIIAGELF